MFQKRWFRITTSVAYGLAAFLLFLYWSFPYDRIKDKILQRLVPPGEMQLSVGSLNPYRFTGVRFKEVQVRKAAEGGAAVSVAQLDLLKLRLQILPLFWGSRSVAFSSKLYDGKLKGRWKSGSEKVDLKTEWENLDLEKGLQYLAEKWGLKFQGDISGNLSIGGDKKDWRKREGALTLQADGAKILASPILGGVLTLPETTFEDLNLQLAIAKGRIVFDKMEVKASTLEGNVDGYISLGKKFSQSRLNLKVTMKPKGELEAQVKDYLPLLKIQKDEKTGEYRFSVVGTFARPRVIK